MKRVRGVGRSPTPQEEARRVKAYDLTTSDAAAARSLGLRQQAFSTWRRSRGLAVKHPTCPRCRAELMGRAKALGICLRCKRDLGRREKRPFRDPEFRKRVRALKGRQVAVSHAAPGVRIARTVGVLRAINARQLLVGRTWISKVDVLTVTVDYVGTTWVCGCGCGQRTTLAYKPNHGPPFFVQGHGHRRRDARGYRTFVGADGKQHPHARLVVEEKLGRPLTRDERVAHVDGDRRNDRPENLIVVPRGRWGRLVAARRKKLTGLALVSYLRQGAPTPPLKRRGRPRKGPAHGIFCPTCGNLLIEGDCACTHRGIAGKGPAAVFVARPLGLPDESPEPIA